MEDLKTWCVLLFFTVAMSVLISIVYRRRLNIHSPPGPMGLPLLGMLPFLHADQLHIYFASLAGRYGSIFSINLGFKPVVVVSSASLCREILSEKDVVFANRDVPVSARILFYAEDDFSFRPYGKEFQMLRRIIKNGLLGKATLDAMHGLRRTEIRAMVKRVEEMRGRPVEIGVEIFTTTLNVITSMMWGGKMHSNEHGGGAMKEMKDFKAQISDLVSLLGKPNVSDFFPMIGWLDLQRVKRKSMDLNKKFDELFEGIISEKKVGINGGGETAQASDFLDVLLGLEKTALTRTNIKGILMDLLSASTDTSSSVMEFAMAEMMRNPSLLTKAQEELDVVVGEGATVEEHHVTKLPYLHAIMKETLRLHPTLPLLIQHSPNQVCTIGGYSVSKDSRVYINAWAIHRDPRTWDDPLEFLPERFLGEDGRSYTGADFNYIPFGAGRRMCVGIEMAEKMSLYMIASLLHSFDWSLLKETKPVSAPAPAVVEKFGFVLKKATPLVAVPSIRLRKSQL